MALEGMLSALKTLILDVDVLPSTSLGRRQLYRELFPDLSDPEVQDLARIPEEGLRIYTATIFTGEGKLLGKHFAMSFSLLRQHWALISLEKFRPSLFIKILHRRRPWKTKTTSGLADSFMAYLAHDVPELLSVCPEILSVARLEELHLQIKRHAVDEMSQQNWVQPDELVSLTVVKLLELECVVSETTQLTSFPFDVVTAFRRFHADGLVPAAIEAKPVFAVGARSADFRVRWQTVPAEVFRFLEAVQLVGGGTVSSLAELFASEDRDEEELFQDFMKVLMKLFVSGAMQLRCPWDLSILQLVH